MIVDKASLESAIRARLTHSQFDAAGALDVVIQMGQMRLKRALAGSGHSPTSEIALSGFFTANDCAIALPAGYLEIRALYIKNDDDTFTPMVPTTREQQGFADSTQGVPNTYYVQGAQIIVNPVPDKAREYRIEFVQEPLALSLTVATNWYIEKAPDALFYACLMDAADDMRESEKIPTYAQAFGEAVNGVIQLMAREKYGHMPPQLVCNYDGS